MVSSGSQKREAVSVSAAGGKNEAQTAPKVEARTVEEEQKESPKIRKSVSFAEVGHSHPGEDDLYALQAELENGGASSQGNRNRVSINIMDRGWKLRTDRWENAVSDKDWSMIKYLLPNVYFAFGPYAGGKILGEPKSVKRIYGPAEDRREETKETTFKPSFLNKDSNCSKEDEKHVKKILKRMVGNCKMPVIRFLGWFLGKLWRYVFSKIEVSGVRDAQEAFRNAARNGKATVFLPTHRSHIDYLLLSYVCYGFNMPIPFIAAGQNLNIPIIGPLLSSAGAFFIRRSMKGDDIYKKTLEEYLLWILKKGHPLEVFMEGGRTRTGTISDPKLGILNMIVKMVRNKQIPDVVFFPVAIDYERVMESEGYAGNLLGMKKQPESFVGAVKAGVRIFMKRNCPGAAMVNFGKTISVKEVINEVNDSLSSFGEDDIETNDAVYTLAVSGHVVQAQRDASTVTAVGLLAAVLLGFSDEDLLLKSPKSVIKPRLKWLLRLILASGAHCAPDLHDVERPINWDDLISSGLRILNPIFKTVDVDCHKADSAAKRRLRLRYACGQIIPILAPYAIVASAIESLTLKRRTRRNVSPSNSLRIHVDEVISHSCNLANVVVPAIDGAKVDRRSICSAFFNLCTAEVLTVKEKRVVLEDFSNNHLAVNMMRTLRVLVAPSINASYAAIVSLLSLNIAEEPEIEVTQKQVATEARDILYNHFDSKTDSDSALSTSSDSTAVGSSIDNNEPDFDFEIEFNETEMKNLEKGKLLGHCLPESLSKAELDSAVKHLIKLNIIEQESEEDTPNQILGRSTLSHSFSCASLSSNASTSSQKRSNPDQSEYNKNSPSRLMVRSERRIMSHLELVKAFIFNDNVAQASELGETFRYKRSRSTYIKIALALGLLLVPLLRRKFMRT